MTSLKAISFAVTMGIIPTMLVVPTFITCLDSSGRLANACMTGIYTTVFSHVSGPVLSCAAGAIDVGYDATPLEWTMGCLKTTGIALATDCIIPF